MEKLEEITITSLVVPLIKDIIVPKIISSLKAYKNEHKTVEELEDVFVSYLYQRYEKFFLIETLVFPNKQTLFNVLYEPLTIFYNTTENNRIEFKINDFPEDLFSKYYRIIIEDTAGMGKSTISQKLFLSIVEKKSALPILIELRKINRKNSILNEIQKQLTPIGELINEELILKLINAGDFIFLFDGFDEISLVDKDYVINELHDFKGKANNNYFLITSRQEDSLVSFGDFQKFNVRELSKEESYNLLRRYDSYSYKPISQELIKKLTSKEQNLDEFLKNPLLVSLLYKSYEFKKDIPIKKSQFYGQVYDALFETHDLSKEGYFKREKYSNLHIDDFERVLRHIGYFTSIKNKIEYDKNFIINVIEGIKKYLPDLSFKSSDFLKDLLNTVPVFKKDGNNFKWSHKSLQDYFSAKFIWIDAKESQKNILKKIYEDQENKRFLNVLDIYYELDIKGFEFTILTWLLRDFKEYLEKNYLEITGIAQDKIIKRIENQYHKKCYIAVMPELQDGEVDEQNVDPFKHNYDKIDYESDVVTYNYFAEPKLVISTHHILEKNKNTILGLLSNRQPTIVKNVKHKIRLDFFALLKTHVIYSIDDKIDNLTNNPKIFDLVSDLMVWKYSINSVEAIKKLNELENNNLKKLNDDLINW